jgi:hypothetical protein
MAEIKAMSDYSARALRAWKTRRVKSAFIKVRASEAASKEALREHLGKRGWQVVFFESKSGAPRTGIIDAFAYRLARKNADLLEVKLIQLKGGKAGASGREIARLKQAIESAALTWAVASFDGEAIHLTTEESGEA